MIMLGLFQAFSIENYLFCNKRDIQCQLKAVKAQAEY